MREHEKAILDAHEQMQERTTDELTPTLSLDMSALASLGEITQGKEKWRDAQ